ncbi:MAG: sugar phosphate nucleotidyltransferase [Bacteroidales bacterium]
MKDKNDNIMTHKNTTVLIMAGGSGERFWPLSTKEKPKQLLRLIDEHKSLIQMTVNRVTPLVPLSNIYIATNAIQAPAVREELPQLPKKNVIIEPAFKDTAAAIGFASIIIESANPGSTMVVLASDHLIKDEENFRSILELAIETANKKEAIVTLGIKPSYAETGYGYLEIESSIVSNPKSIPSPVKVIRFCEKPAAQLATQYLKEGRHLWNSGMFIFKTSIMLDAFRRLLPNHYQSLIDIRDLGNEMRNPNSPKLKEIFTSFEKISIDYGIMEQFENTLVIPSDFGWNDIGSYPALAQVFKGNENNTVVKGTTTKELSSTNNIVISTTGKKISLLGINNMVIVETPTDILVCTKAEAQNIKKLI